MTAKKHERRRKYLLNKKIQLTLTTLVILAILLSSFAISVAIYCFYFSSLVEQIGAEKAAALGLKIWGFGDRSLIITQALLLISFSIWFGIYSIIFLHRIIGPLMRIKKAMAELKEKGYTQRIHIRGNDYLTELVDAFNEMAESLEKKYGAKNV